MYRDDYEERKDEWHTRGKQACLDAWTVDETEAWIEAYRAGYASARLEAARQRGDLDAWDERFFGWREDSGVWIETRKARLIERAAMIRPLIADKQLPEVARIAASIAGVAAGSVTLKYVSAWAVAEDDELGAPTPWVAKVSTFRPPPDKRHRTHYSNAEGSGEDLALAIADMLREIQRVKRDGYLVEQEGEG